MKVIISGYGRMGHMIEGVLLERGITVAGTSEDICATDPALAKECVCIDFTTPDAFKANYKFLAANFKAVVVGTTGWDEIRGEVLAEFKARGTTLIYSSNFSIGVNAMFAAVEKISTVLRGHGYVPHIEETHHIHKLDAPSGTAKALAAIVSDGLGVTPDITSVREGEVPGIHIVKFKSEVDKIKVCHEAFSRQGLAEGAVVAALMTEKVTGVHEFKEILLG
ncbi:MAG: 4-hydroxy-tetrahydrodipicolinate reductase [Bacteroidales bacterium]|nr:4-hydroxy-tetrahydrodipicolinate reductase [Bacteroidales bacterium]